MSESKEQTTAQKLVGDFAPKLAELTDDVLYADIWERPQLSQRDRSLVTVSALIALNRPDQLRSHLVRAKANGLTEEQLVETITDAVEEECSLGHSRRIQSEPDRADTVVRD